MTYTCNKRKGSCVNMLIVETEKKLLFLPKYSYNITLLRGVCLFLKVNIRIKGQLILESQLYSIKKLSLIVYYFNKSMIANSFAKTKFTLTQKLYSV